MGQARADRMIGRRATPSADDDEGPKGFDDFDLRLGDLMRGERATLGKSLLDVQRDLKIKATYIAAIENADPTAFETQGFVAGYVRSYARYLGMDPDWAFARFCAEAGFTTAHGMSAAASSSRASRSAVQAKAYADPLSNPNATFVPRGQHFMAQVQPAAIGSVLVLIGLIAAMGYGGWSVLQQVQQVQVTPVEQAPGVVASLDPVTGATEAELAQADTTDSGVSLPSVEALDRLYRPQALDTPVLVARDGPIAAITPGSTGVFAGMSETVAGVAQTPVPAAQALPGGFVPGMSFAAAPVGVQPGGVQVIAASAPAVELIAVRPSWVRVSAADGAVLFEKILDAGERYVIPASEVPPVLRAGNSGSVYFGVNGQTYGPAAPGAQVVKNVVLSPEALQGKFALADLTADPDLASIVKVAEVAIPPQVPVLSPAITASPAAPALQD